MANWASWPLRAWARAALISICLLRLLQGRHRQVQWEEEQEEEDWKPKNCRKKKADREKKRMVPEPALP